jgi:hypothetical protein
LTLWRRENSCPCRESKPCLPGLSPSPFRLTWLNLGVWLIAVENRKHGQYPDLVPLACTRTLYFLSYPEYQSEVTYNIYLAKRNYIGEREREMALPHRMSLNDPDYSVYHKVIYICLNFTYPVRCLRVIPGVQVPQVEDHCSRQ